jgi:hypothetical protein
MANIAQDTVAQCDLDRELITYRLTWIGEGIGEALTLKDCGKHFRSLREAQNAASEFNITRALRNQPPCTYILKLLSYQKLHIFRHKPREIAALFLLDGTQIVGPTALDVER